MKKKHKEVIEFLLTNQHTSTSKEIANALHISPRSVKTYVIEINLLSKDRTILSSKSGYRINVDEARKLLDHEEDQIPQTWEERSVYIIKQLMLSHSSHIDIYGLCDELYVGYSTLKADIARMNKAYANFNVRFSCENETLHILGDEKNIRKLISSLVQEETSQQLMDISMLQESFPNIDIHNVSALIHKTFHKYNYYINDFSFMNLLLHFVIIINRIKEGNIVVSKKDDYSIESAHEQALVEELCNQLSDIFHIVLDPSEQFEIYMLFKTNANYSLPNSNDTLRKIVGDEILEETKCIVHKVSEDYYIDLDTEGFITPFSLHIKNLILRAQNNKFTKNPMVESIKNSCPTVYDIAIYISLELMQHYRIHINEDEVTFLALHVGAEIERQKSNSEKVKCVLLCPDYMNITTDLYNQLLIAYGNQITILKTISYEDELDGLSYDILITTIKPSRKRHHLVCVIPPFSANIHLKNIQHTIDTFKLKHKRYLLKRNFKEFFSKELFLSNTSLSTRDEVIQSLSEKMRTLDYVNDSFQKNVMIREEAASTAFGNIAIPHSMEMEALQTSIAVALSSKGFLWEEHTVHVVLLVAINKVDKRIFHDLYETLVMLFSEQHVIDQAKECKSFKDFENLIYTCIASQEDY